MGLIQKMTDKMRDGLRRFLQLTPAPENVIVIDEGLDFLANCAKNRIWYHGKSRQLSQLYTRQRLVGLLSKTLPKLVAAALNAQAMIVRGEKPIADNLEIKAKFGEYANPSFESQVETVSKARTGGVMSIRTAVDEMYGDSKDEEWKNEEERRIKEENGIAVLPETSALDDVTV